MHKGALAVTSNGSAVCNCRMCKSVTHHHETMTPLYILKTSSETTDGAITPLRSRNATFLKKRITTGQSLSFKLFWAPFRLNEAKLIDSHTAKNQRRSRWNPHVMQKPCAGHLEQALNLDEIQIPFRSAAGAGWRAGSSAPS